MPLTDAQKKVIAVFRDRVESAIAEEELLGPPERDDREDDSTLATRWPWGEHVWFEVAIRPFLPQVRVGILTDDRWRSEDFEQLIEDSGDTMQEFVELGFDTAGLNWADPPVEHYRDQGKYFYFATPLTIASIDELAADDLGRKVCIMLKGYHLSFSGAAH